MILGSDRIEQKELGGNDRDRERKRKSDRNSGTSGV